MADIEHVLESIDGKRIRKALIKVYRSSEEQFRHYCDTKTKTKCHQLMSAASNVPNVADPMSSMLFRTNPVPDLGEKNHFS